MITLVPLTRDEANAFVAVHHRHSRPCPGAKFCIGVTTGEQLVGVAIVGRPVSRMLDDSFTAEVLRVCTIASAPRNCCSMLYGAAWRAWRAMGGRRIVTYTLESERGTSVAAAGWRIVHKTKAESWSRDGRERDWQPVYGQRKFRWERSAA